MRFRASLILFFCMLSFAEASAYPGTYRGGKILTLFGTDSLVVDGETRYFNYDTLFYRIMTEGYTPEVQNINVHYFVDIVDHMTYEGQLRQIDRFRQAAKAYKSKQLTYEVDFLNIWYYPNETEEQFETKARMMDEMIERMEKTGEVDWEIRCREYIANIYWERGLYVRPFREFPIIDKLLDKITDVNKSGVNGASKKKFYYWFGQCYYLFRDFDKAVHYYERATVQPEEYLYEPFHLYDETNLLARIALGRYYREEGDLETSDAYFRSMLDSPDSLTRRDMFDAIAWCNLGENMQIRKEYPEAVRVLERYLPVIAAHERHSLSAEMAVSLGECYLALDRPEKVRAMIDSAQHYLSLAGGDNHVSLSYAFAGNADHIPALYRLKSKYYALRGDIAAAGVSIDSSAYYQRTIDERYSSLVILRAEQELFEAEKSELQRESTFYKTRMFYALAVAGLVLLLLGVYIYLYRQKRRAYRELVRRTQQWAYAEPPLPDAGREQAGSVDEIPVLDSDTDDGELPVPTDDLSMRELFARIENIFRDGHLYRTPDITLDQVAQRLGSNRVYVSQAVNRMTGKNFSAYVNEYRVKEAVRLMTDADSLNLSIDAIATEAGFSDRKAFHRVFKSSTGLSPSNFRNNIEKQ